MDSLIEEEEEEGLKQVGEDYNQIHHSFGAGMNYENVVANLDDEEHENHNKSDKRKSEQYLRKKATQKNQNDKSRKININQESGGPEKPNHDLNNLNVIENVYFNSQSSLDTPSKKPPKAPPSPAKVQQESSQTPERQPTQTKRGQKRTPSNTKKGKPKSKLMAVINSRREALNIGAAKPLFGDELRKNKKGRKRRNNSSYRFKS